jgi:LuxR family transcriptional regulator, maltose regulon positive regulatory protein
VATEATGVLVDTKFNPAVLGELVQRPRLIEALARSRETLKLIRAPAGWGKSTLVAAWAASEAEERPFAWLALEPADDQPTRFWLCVTEALHRLDPAIGDASVRLLSAPGTDLVQQVLPQLVNEVAAVREPAVLAIDDYHRITRHEVHRQLAYFVEHLPPTLQVSLASRSEPPLPLGRWRARRELLEIDVADLRFGTGEASELLNGILDLDLSNHEVARLDERTEGWVAGLYLAALSIRGMEDRGRFVERFAGDDRHIVDYLGAEVLDAQPEAIRESLVRIAVLDRFCPSLVEAVAGADNGAAILREIEAAGLFLIPLDSQREWYRFHHLFQQLLRLELARRGPELERDLHRRAAAWYLAAGSAADAINHTLAAGDRDQAVELIAQHWAATLLAAAGDLAVDSWLRQLGDDAVAEDFRLCFARCFIGLSLGDMGVVRRWLDVAEAAPVRGPFYEGLASKAGGLASIRAALLWESGDAGRSRDAGREVLAEEGEASPWRAIGAATIGLGAGAYGEWAEASRWTQEYGRLGEVFGQHLNHQSGLGSASIFEAELGNWARAEGFARRSIKIAGQYGIDEHWSSAHGQLGLALALEHRGELDPARRYAERAAVLVRRGYGPVSTANVLIHIARIQAASGAHDAARATLDEAESHLGEAADAGILPQRLAKARHHLGGGRRGEAAPGEELTDRELDVLRLLATDRSRREIGNSLYVSLNTVKSHTRSIFRKLEVSDRVEAVARARELGLI